LTQVKICGVRDAPCFDAAVEAGADWIGLNFYPASPRAVTPAQAATLAARRAPGGPQLVGLFVDPTDADVARVLAEVPLDILQLYTQRQARAADIAASAGLPFWQPVAVSASADLPASMGAAAALLIEGRAPAAATRPGGNASAFDWSLARAWSAPGPWLLAGGLTPENVAAAIAASGAEAVDVSSGVESAPGRKDQARIRAFIVAAKRG
jgi:phosphoribosylanthranilate isomerase